MTRILIVLASIGLAFLIGGSYESDFYAVISFFLLFYFLLDFIYSLGRSFRVLDMPILFSIFQLLVMPVIVYHLYNEDLYVKALKYDMSVNKEDYFSFMIPAILALVAGLKFPLGGLEGGTGSTQFYKNSAIRIRAYLKGNDKTGIILILLGFSFGVFEKILPSSLYYFLFLFSKLTYVGIYYIYFSESPKRNIYLAGGLTLAIAQALFSGIFGDLVYLSVLTVLLLLIGKKINFAKSIALTVIGFFLVLVLQTVKAEYRKTTWGDSTADKTSAFINIATEKVINFDNNFTMEGIFPVVVRFNQGMIVGKVMDYVPSITPYQEGRTIWLSLAASFIPRFVWPDKPEAGGQANMRLFTGFDIQGYSMNVGPYGEAWGNFGKTGGIIYMFFYGLFFNFVFYQILKHSHQQPTILLWVPYLFLNSIQVETDTLLTVNTIIKGVLFIWLFTIAFQKITRLKL